MEATRHVTSVRPGVVGPGEPGHRVFESNFVIECSCGFRLGCSTTNQSSALRRRDDHVRTGR